MSSGPSRFLNEHLRAVKRASERHLGREGYVALDRNERVSPIPDAQLRDMLASVTMRSLAEYPDAGPLIDRLSRAVGLSGEWIAETAGADAGIRRIFMAFLKPGAAVVTLNPSYAMYEIYTSVFQGAPRRVDVRADRSVDVETLLAAIAPGTGLVVLPNPNQPTGVALPPGDIRRIVQRAYEAGAVCVIDEAYYPFHPQSAQPLIVEFDNLIVLRSFSKYPGCAGIRIGYALAQPQLINGLMAVRGGSEVSGVSMAMACYLLDHPRIAEDFRTAVEAGRKLLQVAATRIGLTPLHCVTNFEVVRCPPEVNADALAETLAAERFLVRAGYRHPSLDNCIRVSLNGADVMAPFVAALERAVAAMQAGKR